MNNKRWMRITCFGLATALLVTGSFAYFSDRKELQSTGTAGSVAISLENKINLLNQAGKDIINPGDMRTAEFTVVNEGNKSVDVKPTIVITAQDTKGNPLIFTGDKDNQSEYDLYAREDVEFVDGHGYKPITGRKPLQIKEVNKDTIKYEVPTYSLNGNETKNPDGVETIPGITESKHKHDYVFVMRGDSDNRWQGSNVMIDVLVEAKQHENTGAGWGIVAHENVTSGSINQDAVAGENVITKNEYAPGKPQGPEQPPQETNGPGKLTYKLTNTDTKEGIVGAEMILYKDMSQTANVATFAAEDRLLNASNVPDNFVEWKRDFSDNTGSGEFKDLEAGVYRLASNIQLDGKADSLGVQDNKITHYEYGAALGDTAKRINFKVTDQNGAPIDGARVVYKNAKTGKFASSTYAGPDGVSYFDAYQSGWVEGNYVVDHVEIKNTTMEDPYVEGDNGGKFYYNFLSSLVNPKEFTLNAQTQTIDVQSYKDNVTIQLLNLSKQPEQGRRLNVQYMGDSTVYHWYTPVTNSEGKVALTLPNGTQSNMIGWSIMEFNEQGPIYPQPEIDNNYDVVITGAHEFVSNFVEPTTINLTVTDEAGQPLPKGTKVEYGQNVQWSQGTVELGEGGQAKIEMSGKESLGHYYVRTTGTMENPGSIKFFEVTEMSQKLNVELKSTDTATLRVNVMNEHQEPIMGSDAGLHIVVKHNGQTMDQMLYWGIQKEYGQDFVGPFYDNDEIRIFSRGNEVGTATTTNGMGEATVTIQGGAPMPPQPPYPPQPPVLEEKQYTINVVDQDGKPVNVTGISISDNYGARPGFQSGSQKGEGYIFMVPNRTYQLQDVTVDGVQYNSFNCPELVNSIVAGDENIPITLKIRRATLIVQDKMGAPLNARVTGGLYINNYTGQGLTLYQDINDYSKFYGPIANDIIGAEFNTFNFQGGVEIAPGTKVVFNEGNLIQTLVAERISTYSATFNFTNNSSKPTDAYQLILNEDRGTPVTVTNGQTLHFLQQNVKFDSYLDTYMFDVVDATLNQDKATDVNIVVTDPKMTTINFSTPQLQEQIVIENAENPYMSKQYHAFPDEGGNSCVVTNLRAGKYNIKIGYNPATAKCGTFTFDGKSPSVTVELKGGTQATFKVIGESGSPVNCDIYTEFGPVHVTDGNATMTLANGYDLSRLSVNTGYVKEIKDLTGNYHMEGSNVIIDGDGVFSATIVIGNM